MIIISFDGKNEIINILPNIVIFWAFILIGKPHVCKSLFIYFFINRSGLIHTTICAKTRLRRQNPRRHIDRTASCTTHESRLDGDRSTSLGSMRRRSTRLSSHARLSLDIGRHRQGGQSRQNNAPKTNARVRRHAIVEFDS